MGVEATRRGSIPINAVGLLGRATRGLIVRAAACGMPLKAFACSRLLVLGAGIAGVLTIPNQFGVSAQFGPIRTASASLVLHQFDASYYLAIATHGYVTTASNNLAFFPLYPLMIRAVGFVTGSDVTAGLLISFASFALALLLLHRLTELELGRRAADATVLLLAFAPLSFFFSAIYTESLFLLLSVAAVLAARRERWAVAGILAGLATLTRPTGVRRCLALACRAVCTASPLPL